MREFELVIRFIDDLVVILHEKLAKEYCGFGHRKFLSRALPLPYGEGNIAARVLLNRRQCLRVRVKPASWVKGSGVVVHRRVEMVDEVARHHQSILLNLSSVREASIFYAHSFNTSYHWWGQPQSFFGASRQYW